MKNYCPICGSDEVYESRSRNSFLNLLVLIRKLRCHRCTEVFSIPVWQTYDPPPPPAPAPKEVCVTSYKERSPST